MIMLRKHNLLTAGLMVLLSVSGRAVALAGGHHGGSSGGGNSSFHAPQFSNHSMGSRSNLQVQPQFNRNSGNVVLPQNQSLKTGVTNTQVMKTQFPQNHGQTVLKTGTLNPSQSSHNFRFPGNLNQNTNHIKLGSTNLVNKTNHIPVLPIHNPSSTAMKGIHFPGNYNPGKISPIFPIKPIKPICPPYGGGSGQCGTGFGGCWGNYGGCWGNGCGFGWGCGNWGCGNWGYGNYGCGYWPGYFGGCYNTPLYQPYPVTVSTPVYVTSTPTVVPTSTSLVLNDAAVPPAPLPPAAPRDIDLAIKDVRIVEAATGDRGALYRVTIVNKGPAALDSATRVAMLAMKDNQPSEDSPRTMETVKGLKVGETTSLDLRMPVAANALPRMLVAVEVPENFKDTNESDNVAAGEAAQIPQLAAVAK